MAGLFTHPGCAPAQGVTAGQSFSLTSPVQQDGVTVFRTTLYVRVPFDRVCDGVRLGSASALTVRFEPATVRVEPGDEAWIDRWSSEIGAATVHMRYPAPVSTVYSSSYRKAALHRVDGDVVADQATVTATTGVALPEPFVGTQFRAQLSEEIPQLVAVQMADAVTAMHHPIVTLMSISAGSGASLPSQHGVANEAAVQAVLARGSMTALDVRGLPGTPRLRLFDEAHEESLWQWLEPGEHATPVSFTAAGPDLVTLLQPALERVFESRAVARESAVSAGTEPNLSPIVLPLEVESDAPCRVVAGPVNLVFELEAELLAEPVTLSFASGADRTEDVVLDPPAGTRVHLQIEGTVAQREAAPLEEPPSLPVGARQGIQLESGSQAASPFHADRPWWACGLAFGWYALSERTVLSAAIFPDAGGLPTAQPLAEARIDVAVASPGWVRGRWPDVPLQPGAYWLRLRVDEGFGVWVGTPGAAHAVWLQTPPGKGATTSIPIGLMVFPLEGQGGAAPPTPPIAMSFNGTGLTLSAPRAGAVSAVLDELAPLSAAGPWSLHATSAHELTLTLQAVRLRYR